MNSFYVNLPEVLSTCVTHSALSPNGINMVNRRRERRPRLKWKLLLLRMPLAPPAKSRGLLFLWPEGLSGQATKKSLRIHFVVGEYCTSYLLTYNIAKARQNKCPASLLSTCTAGVKKAEETPLSPDSEAGDGCLAAVLWKWKIATLRNCFLFFFF